MLNNINETKAQVITDKQIKAILDDHFMSEPEYFAQFKQEVPKEQYTVYDVLTWLNY